MGILGGGVAACFLKFSPNFRPKNVIFHTRFQTRPLKSMPVFRPGLLIGTNYVIITWPLEHKQKIIQIHFRMFSLSFLLIWKWNAKYIHTLCSSLENHTWCQAKNGKVYTHFQTKTVQKPYTMGRHIPIWLIQWSTPHLPPQAPSPPTFATNIVCKGAVISKANTFFASIENFFRIDWIPYQYKLKLFPVICCLRSMARMDIDWNLKKLAGPTFIQVLKLYMPTKITRNLLQLLPELFR